MPTPKEELIRRGIPLHDIQHSQHRRAPWQDYGGCGLYMVTLCIEGRQPLFGRLEGNIRARREAAEFPHIVLSPLGSAILNEELPKIHRFYPEVELWQAAIMPDHIHLLLYVAQPLPKGKRLGHVIGAFMGGCSRAWWAAGGGVKTAADAAGTTATGTTAAAGTTAATRSAATVENAAARTITAAAVPAALAAVRDKGLPLFEQGYHDRIIKRPGMLETIKCYMSDNPLRALMRRQLPLLMRRGPRQREQHRRARRQ